MDVEADKHAKIVVDPVYGTIHLDFLAVKIIDTPYFQRLRYIKQLAFADFVYPGATHTRFAHSIGVYHLACKMIKEIEAQNLPEGAVKMSTLDKRCVRVAALCHDLGHGPFSHLYEQIGETILEKDKCPKLKHEKISQFLVEKMFEECKLKGYLGTKADRRIKLIKDLIERERDLTEQENKKKYMFQIVSNKESGVDVDKWDYFNRDAKACGVPERFQYDRALSVARVVQTKHGMFELGYRDYDAFNMYNLFNTRLSLYRKVYKHNVVQAVDLMITDACNLVCEANKQFDSEQRTKIDLYPITSEKKKEGPYIYMKLDDSHYLDVDKYLKLRDDVLLKIADTSEDMYKGARDLIQRIHTRNLYRLFDDICVKVAKRTSAQKKAEKIKKQIEEGLKKEFKDITDVAEVKLVRFDYGLKQMDPVGKLYFYKKKNYEKGKKLKKDEERIAKMMKEDKDSLLPRICQKHLNIGFELINGSSKEQQGYHPRPGGESPSWCICNNCREMQTDEEKQCGKQITPNCYSRLPVPSVLPNVFQEYHVRVYEKFTGKEKVPIVKKNCKTLERILKRVRNPSTNQKKSTKKQKVDRSTSNMKE